MFYRYRWNVNLLFSAKTIAKFWALTPTPDRYYLQINGPFPDVFTLIISPSSSSIFSISFSCNHRDRQPVHSFGNLGDVIFVRSSWHTMSLTWSVLSLSVWPFGSTSEKKKKKFVKLHWFWKIVLMLRYCNKYMYFNLLICIQNN